ncbi:LOW QUALITY PROTEIN: trichohyalin-like [Drosophila sulfurigaster albostrigata]|uniref:LOW QUALITY PROTEIN: trichohyalin-like n=1 Tax=Drosophila sulfurigaster albostrigata TaxID=89887 RepID=UPI002D219151|nr:LOW QUALITY PROTEIN: trichohyalin-like [Drosophila sulfurigaster albostrigata]
MSGRGRRQQVEPARNQYGAWDDPRVSLFATVPQEPLDDMLGRMKRLPETKRKRDMEALHASPLLLATSPSTSRLYREVKYQVQQIADDRNRNYHPIQEREHQSAMIAQTMAVQNRREFAEAMRRQQLNVNSQRLRDLQTEIDRAKTTLSVVKRRHENVKTMGNERERKEAQATQEKLQKGKLAEQQAVQRKARDYSQQLVQQIKIRSEREEKQFTEREEGRQKRQKDVLAYAADLRQELEWRHVKRIELRRMLDEYSTLNRNLRDKKPAEAHKLDVIVLEAMGPVTASFLRQEMQRRADSIERRRLISDDLGQQLNEKHNQQVAHDNMIADILVCERKAREKKRAHQEVQERHERKQQVAIDLINQCKEHRLYADKDAKLGQITRDATSFMERQYQQAADREAASRAINKASYDAIATDMVSNMRLRAAAVEEERMIMKALQDMELEMEGRVDEERMRVLHAQARDIIEEVRPCKLSHAERQTFGLPACSLHDDDKHNTHTT